MRTVFGEAIFWIAAVCTLVAQIAILRTAFRAPNVPENSQVPRPSAAWEAAWAVLPAIALIGLFALTWQAMHRGPAAASVEVSTSVHGPAAR